MDPREAIVMMYERDGPDEGRRVGKPEYFMGTGGLLAKRRGGRLCSRASLKRHDCWRTCQAARAAMIVANGKVVR
jgi:hypothetical protein